ncbi:MAG TPA: DUF4124 domain-containing protein [Burkholderiales bacterium]|nr:DUF4124 domain-containing protein [Burkholderiales bacterium]
MKLQILICALLFSAGSGLAGPLYRWVDSDGTVHYSDQSPPSSAQNIQEKRLGANVIEANQSYEMARAAKYFPVTLYATDCGTDCNKARQLLKKRAVPYKEKNPSKQRENADALKKISGDLLVPVLVVGDSQILKGYDEVAWNNALDTAGYPKPTAPAAEAPRTETTPAANLPPAPVMTAPPPAPKSNY